MGWAQGNCGLLELWHACKALWAVIVIQVEVATARAVHVHHWDVIEGGLGAKGAGPVRKVKCQGTAKACVVIVCIAVCMLYYVLYCVQNRIDFWIQELDSLDNRLLLLLRGWGGKRVNA